LQKNINSRWYEFHRVFLGIVISTIILIIIPYYFRMNYFLFPISFTVMIIIIVEVIWYFLMTKQIPYSINIDKTNCIIIFRNFIIKDIKRIEKGKIKKITFTQNPFTREKKSMVFNIQTNNENLLLSHIDFKIVEKIGHKIEPEENNEDYAVLHN